MFELGEHTWPEADALDTRLAVLPVGSTEQHGPHAPLGTDRLSAEAIASAGADAYGGEVVVAPTVPVGVSEEHRAFAGTLWVGETAFRAYVRDLLESLLAQGWDRVVVVNGHGGNVGPLREVTARVTRDQTQRVRTPDGDRQPHRDRNSARERDSDPDRSGARVVPFTWFDTVDAPEMGHAGPVETSLLRHTHPDLIREDRIVEAAADAADRWGEWVGGANLAHDTDEFAPNGVVGDPRESSADEGARLLPAAGDSLAAVLGALAEC
jgi:creatinine amidohydrolase